MERRRVFGHLFIQNPTETVTNEKPPAGDAAQDDAKINEQELPRNDSVSTTAEEEAAADNNTKTNSEHNGDAKRRSCLPSHAAVAETLREHEFLELLESAFAKIVIGDDEFVEPTTTINEKGPDEGVDDDDSFENVTTLPDTAFCRSPQRFCLKDMHRPASYDKSIKLLLQAKKHRTEKITHAKSLEMRNYDNWDVSSGGKQTRRRTVALFDKSNIHISSNESWLINRSMSGNSSSIHTNNGMPHTRLNISSSMDGIDLTSRTSTSSNRSRSPSHASSNNKSTPSSSLPLPPPPPIRTAIDMILFPANVSFGNDGSTVTTSRERQVIMARLMSTPEKLPKKHGNTHRHAKEERDKLTNKRNEEIEKLRKERIRMQAKATAEQQEQGEGNKSSESSSFLRALRKSFVHTNIDPELAAAAALL